MEQIPPIPAETLPPKSANENGGMVIKYANFIGSFTHNTQCPKPDKPEYAFIGRSNVGKSSLINMLTAHSSLARVSHTRPAKRKRLTTITSTRIGI